MSPYLLEQVPPLLGRDFGQLLFGGRQQALEADDQEVADQVVADVLGASAPVFLLKVADPFADGSLDFSLSFIVMVMPRLPPRFAAPSRNRPA